MSLRVIQWATGRVGRAAIEGVVRHPDLELVGCRVNAIPAVCAAEAGIKTYVDLPQLAGRAAPQLQR